jgi:phospholipid/cholesterol/gamma-HCH transport system ATP-binding protein
MVIQSLRLEKLTFGYMNSAPVFSNLEFDMPLGENIFITGHAANGQSTLLKLLAVVVQPQTGHYFINDQDTTAMSFIEFLPLRKAIGYSFDYGGLFSNRTLRDNLTLPLLYHKISSFEEANRYVEELAEKFLFSKQLGNRPAEVSGGLRKVVCVLRSLVMRPEMLVLDDPFTGVDVGSAKKIIDLLEESRSQSGLRHVFFTSRDETWPNKIPHRKLIIENHCLRRAA